MEEVAQHDIAVMVEAAGHEASVCQHTYLLDKRLAEHLSSLDVTLVFLAVACFLSFFSSTLRCMAARLPEIARKSELTILLVTSA